MREESWFDEAAFRKLKTTVKPAVLRKLLELFLQNTAERVKEVQATDAVGEPDKLAYALHSLKGSALMVGARELEVAAEDLREATRAGEDEELRRRRDDLTAALKRVHARLRRELQGLEG